ncbi:MAG: sigma-E processing peptidase SpoIIGA [Bacteroides sp.]|nr:sigma-E processing peptidase SpoIIGA [Bacteroides sp.]MCM1548637.1 sigma-E processing peptidase SpoIIGA [Clostridium sp.]
MKYTIYLDVLFLINFGMDFLIIWLTGRLCGQRASWWRYLISPLAGSTLLILLTWLPIPFPWMYYIGSYGMIGMIMCCLAFRPTGIWQGLKCYGCQLMITFLLGGIMNWLYFSTPLGEWCVHSLGGQGLQLRELFLLVLLSGGIIAVLTTGFRQLRREQGQETYQISLYFEGHNIYGTGFVDTGNFLKDPLSRRPVAVVSADWLSPVLPDAYRRLVTVYLETGRIDYDRIAEEKLQKARWIPFQAIGEQQGELLGLQCEKMILRRNNVCMTRRNVIIGISPTPIASHERYQMLLHREMIEQEE